MAHAQGLYAKGSPTESQDSAIGGTTRAKPEETVNHMPSLLLPSAREAA